MRLKDAYRVSNCLSRLVEEGKDYISSRCYEEKKEFHKLADAELGENKWVNVEPKSSSLINGEKVNFKKAVSLLLNIIDEKEKLAIAIAKAKAEAEICLDAAKQSNIDKQSVLNKLSSMGNLAVCENEELDRLYGKDNEGKQAAYVYKKKVVTSYDVDKAFKRGVEQSLRKCCEKVSQALDKALIEIDVDFESQYDCDLAFADIYCTESLK